MPAHRRLHRRLLHEEGAGMKTLLSIGLGLAFLLVFFGAQALSRGPDDIEAARDSAQALRDARQQAQAAAAVQERTERAAWQACREVYGELAQPTERPGGEFGCQRLAGVL